MPSTRAAALKSPCRPNACRVRAATSLATSLLSRAGAGGGGSALWPSGSSVPGERPRGRGLGRCALHLAVSPGEERPVWGPGRSVTRLARPSRGSALAGHRGGRAVRGSPQPTLGKDGSTNECFTTAHTPKREFESSGGGAGSAGGSPGARSVQRAVKWGVRHAQ